MAKPIGASCNLECTYCYYLDKSSLYPDRNDFRMDEETLDRFVRSYIRDNPASVVTFAWQGGEPTLRGIEFYRTAVSLQEKYAPPDTRVQNTFQTNGTLLDDEWGVFLAANDFLVGISIDGPAELHDTFRQTRGGGGTHEQVMAGLDVLQRHNVPHNALCVLNTVNSRHPAAVYEFFADLGIDWIQFIPLVEHRPDSQPMAVRDPVTPGHDIPRWVREAGGAVRESDSDFDVVVEAARNAPVSPRSVDPVAYGEFMCRIFDQWVREDLGERSVRLFDQAIERRLQKRSSLCVFSEQCGSQMAIEHNGDVYACDHFVDPAYLRGNIHERALGELVNADEQQTFGAFKRTGLPARCVECPVREYCNGGCPKNWHLATPAGELGLNYLCPGYRRLFTYLEPYLDIIEETVDRGLALQLASEAVAVRDGHHRDDQSCRN